MAKFVRAAQLIRSFKQSAAPTVAQGLTLDDIWVDTDDHATYVCTAVSPVTFTALGSGGTPGGSNTQVQYNDSSSFAGDAGFTYNKTTHVLTTTGFVGTLTGNVTGNCSGSSGSCTGNAGTVTNGVYTIGSYADPAWITSLAGSKISGNISGNAATVTTNANLTGVVTSSGNATVFATMTANNVLLGNGTATPQVVAPGTSGNVLTSNGTTWVSSAAAGGSGLSQPQVMAIQSIGL